MYLHIYADRENKRPKSLNTSRTQLFTTCLGVVFLHVFSERGQLKKYKQTFPWSPIDYRR